MQLLTLFLRNLTLQILQGLRIMAVCHLLMIIQRLPYTIQMMDLTHGLS